MPRRLGTILPMLTVWCATAGAVQTTMDFEAIDEAMVLGRSSNASARARFHEAYRRGVPKAPVDFVEIVTPFRRIVIASQQHAEAGDRSFNQRQALEMLKATGPRLDVRVEMTFHPQNNYIGVPAYQVFLSGEGNRRVTPRSVDRLSRWTPRVDGLPPPAPSGGDSGPSRGRPLLGGTLVALFELDSLEPQGAYDVVVAEEGRELAKVRIDLGRMR